jgi:hypothetical protein
MVRHREAWYKPVVLEFVYAMHDAGTLSGRRKLKRVGEVSGEVRLEVCIVEHNRMYHPQ